MQLQSRFCLSVFFVGRCWGHFCVVNMADCIFQSWVHFIEVAHPISTDVSCSNILSKATFGAMLVVILLLEMHETSSKLDTNTPSMDEGISVRWPNLILLGLPLGEDRTKWDTSVGRFAANRTPTLKGGIGRGKSAVTRSLEIDRRQVNSSCQETVSCVHPSPPHHEGFVGKEGLADAANQL